MSGHTYLAAAAYEHLTHAQIELDQHLTSARNGRCRTCGQETPCPWYELAIAAFARYGVLPKRTKGIAGRHLTADTGPGLDARRRETSWYPPTRPAASAERAS